MPLMEQTYEQRQDIVTEALINGDPANKALIKAGFSPKTANGAGKRTLKNLNIDERLQEWRERHAQNILDKLSRCNTSDKSLQQFEEAVQQVDKPGVKARLLLEASKVKTQRQQDLLDRMGISKISKSMRITAKVNTRDSEAVSKRIAEIEAKLSNQKAQPGVKKTIKGQYRTVNSEVIQGADTVQDSQTASICQTVPCQTTKNDLSNDIQADHRQTTSLDGITEHVGEGDEI